MSKDVILFARRLLLKSLHANTDDYKPGSEPGKGFKTQDYRNIKMLFELLEENLDYFDYVHVEEQGSTVSKLQTYKRKSTTFPPFFLNNSVSIFVREVLKDIQDTEFYQQEILNLNTYQKTAVKEFSSLQDIIIKPYHREVTSCYKTSMTINRYILL